MIFGTLRAINPDIPQARTDISSLENPDFFKAELEQAGFSSVEIHRITGETPIHKVEDFWSDMVRASAPVTMMKNGMGEHLWAEKSQLAIDFLRRNLGGGTATLHAHAWLGLATKVG